MKTKNEMNRKILCTETSARVSGGNYGPFIKEGLKILIAYWGSIKTGFRDGFNDYMHKE